jgi:hypothetical protein
MGNDDHDQGDDERRSNDDEGDAGVSEQCTAIGVLGACDEPADMHCPGCGLALCFAYVAAPQAGASRRQCCSAQPAPPRQCRGTKCHASAWRALSHGASCSSLRVVVVGEVRPVRRAAVCGVSPRRRLAHVPASAASRARR